MLGEPDPIYVEARHALLDALEALTPHLDSLIVVGAQAIYVHAGEADVAVAPYTKDADVAIDPRTLGSDPTLDDAMRAAGFKPGEQPGIWKQTDTLAQVDLLVPESLGGPGRHRGARIEGQSPQATRRVGGMEAALVDNAVMSLGSLDASDPRVIDVRVAGPAALLVTKLHKLGERQLQPGRLNDKDAHDVYRLLVATSTNELAQGLGRLNAAPLSSQAAGIALGHLRSLFASPDAIGSLMAARATGPLADPNTIANAVAALTEDLLRQIEFGSDQEIRA
jgi:hypothetical protein